MRRPRSRLLPSMLVAPSATASMGLLTRSLPEVCALVGTLVMGFASAAHAQATVYQYTGHPFTTFTAPWTGTDFVSVMMTLANPLGPNLHQVSELGNLISLSMSDGIQTLSCPGATCSYVNVLFSTDPGGAISGWEVTLISSALGEPDVQTCNTNSLCGISDSSMPSNVGPLNANFNSPGAWIDLPEPGAALQLAVGVVAIMGLGLRRRPISPPKDSCTTRPGSPTRCGPSCAGTGATRSS